MRRRHKLAKIVLLSFLAVFILGENVMAAAFNGADALQFAAG